MPSSSFMPNTRTRQPSDGAGDAVAIKIERGEIGRADIGAHVHFHAVDHREKVLAPQAESLHRLRQAFQPCRRLAGIERIDIAPPLRELPGALGAVAAVIGDVVDRAAESVDVVHGLALRARQDAHGGVERRAGGGGGGIGPGLVAVGLLADRLRLGKPARGALHDAEYGEAGDFQLPQMHALGQRIVRPQHAGQFLRQPLDHRHFQTQATIGDLCRERRAVFQQHGQAPADVVETSAQLRRGGRRLQLLDAGTVAREQVERQIDAVEIAVVGGAVLQVIDDLQRGAQRVVGGPRRARLAMHVEHETADRHGRVAAVVHQVGPVAVAPLDHVHAEGGDEVARMLRIEPARAQLGAQRHAFRLGVALAEQRGLQAVEQFQLLGLRQRSVIGDVVGHAHEIVERQDRLAIARRDQSRGHREILVPVSLAAAHVGGERHRAPRRPACTRPFHWPPRPRAYCSADSLVHSV